MWTLKARLVAALSLAAALVGLATARWFPFLLAVSLGATLAWSRFALKPSQALHGDRSLSLNQVPEGEPFEVRTRVGTTGENPVFATVHEDLDRRIEVTEGQHATGAALDGSTQASVEFEAKAHVFDVYDVGPIEARLEDPLGFVIDHRTPVGADELVATPAQAQLEEPTPDVSEFQTFQGEYLVNQPGDGFDFYGLREYGEGDTFRAINWKATAKTGDLMVNQFERNTSSEVTIVVDGRAITGIGPEDRTPYVLAGRAVAALLDELFDRRDSPRVILYGDQLHHVQPGPQDRVVNETLETLATIDPEGQIPLSHHLGDILPRVAPGTPIVLLSPFVADPTILESVTQILANEVEMLAVAIPLPDLPGDTEELEALRAERQATIEGLKGFDIPVRRPNHLKRFTEVAP